MCVDSRQQSRKGGAKSLINLSCNTMISSAMAKSI